MKKIIDGKMYNTETAKKVANWSNGLYVNDLDFLDETLYLKRTGEFFLEGDGGARTTYAHPCSGGGWCGGIEIVPLTIDEAREWVEEKCSAEIYIDLFGEPEE